MSAACIHFKSYPGTLYEPPEAWCDIDEDGEYDCESCPHRYSEEDYEADRADFLYDLYRDSLFDNY